MKQYCPCGHEIAGPARDGSIVIKSRAVLYDEQTGQARAICNKCHTEVPIHRSHTLKTLVLKHTQHD